MNKLYCIGDGYATGHIWPEWPQILQALLPDVEVSVIAGIGAGDEWMVTQLVHELPNISGSTVIFQWPMIGRFDKLIQDQAWQKIAESDPVYFFNFYNSHHQRWWLSSASSLSEIKNYHNTVQHQQHQQRQKNFRVLVEHTLKNLNCTVIYTSTEEQEQYSRQQRFSLSRQCEIQPSPIVHFYFVKDVLMPQLHTESLYVDSLEQAILNQPWRPYDPDRDSIWASIKESIQK
jgi:hypothetical protein